jgi:hypothetical protein
LKGVNDVPHIFTGQEIAMGYALSAERIFNNDYEFLKDNPSVIPILVNQLFQSIEISIKYAGIESGLFTEREAKDRGMRQGHGIKEIAALSVERLGGDPFDPIIMAITHFSTLPNSGDIIRRMICGEEFEKTRECYATRCLGYGQVADGDFALVDDIGSWIQSVKETATNLPETIDILKKWKVSPSKSKVFAIWIREISGGT